MAATYIKDPDATLDYVWDWSGWLAEGESIDTATVTPDPGLTLTEPASLVDSNHGVLAWLTGGNLGVTYAVVCHIETDGGRIDERTVTIQIKDR